MIGYDIPSTARDLVNAVRDPMWKFPRNRPMFTLFDMIARPAPKSRNHAPWMRALFWLPSGSLQ